MNSFFYKCIILEQCKTGLKIMKIFLLAFYVIFRFTQVVFKCKPILVIQSKPAPITGQMVIADFIILFGIYVPDLAVISKERKLHQLRHPLSEKILFGQKRGCEHEFGRDGIPFIP